MTTKQSEVLGTCDHARPCICTHAADRHRGDEGSCLDCDECAMYLPAPVVAEGESEPKSVGCEARGHVWNNYNSEYKTTCIDIVCGIPQAAPLPEEPCAFCEMVQRHMERVHGATPKEGGSQPPCEWNGRNLGEHDFIDVPGGQRCTKCKFELEPTPSPKQEPFGFSGYIEVIPNQDEQVELPPCEPTVADFKMGEFLAQEALEYVKMDGLAQTKYAELCAELECRERQLLSGLNQLSAERKRVDGLRGVLDAIVETVNRLPSATGLYPVRDYAGITLAISDLQSSYKDAARSRNGQYTKIQHRAESLEKRVDEAIAVLQVPSHLTEVEFQKKKAISILT